MRRVAVGNDATESAVTSAPEDAASPLTRKSYVDSDAEEAALACVRRGQRDEALRILVMAYGAPLTAFAVRILRSSESARDVRQQVFLEAFQGIDKFAGRSSVWGWLCGIAYHRSLDELNRLRRVNAVEDFDVLDAVAAPPDPMMDADLVSKRRALEHCLGKLPVSLRSQLLMKYHLGLSYIEIGEIVGAAPSTVQVRMSRILPRLRRCLREEGIAR
jgi:RNA polymerase sigma-70 factor, ECF subfamily